ncbi:flagellar biosynthetic protein FliQ [Paludisphaera rhizosphaerae]|uniref:flagellar biosynthetic protein FliQ n=1 Tax=Paludisphaera rhizosphaerae TaxID=2711216 RepID=UPI0013ED2928|nr:flagellar biosynthetic protein FliQ [Paludisphaera rhizosphaerae]
MDLNVTIDWTREALRLALMLGGPILAAALVVGLAVNVLQTMTQLNEPVVGLVPRLVAVVVATLVLLPWLAARWIEFTVDLIGSIPDML